MKYNINKIQYETLYKNELFKRLSSELGCPIKFRKMNKERRFLVYKKLQEISLLKDHSEIFDAKNDYKKYQIKFNKEFESFKEIIINEKKRILTRKDSGHLINQFLLSISYLQNMLYQSGYITMLLDTNVILKEVNQNMLFNIIIESALNSMEYINVGKRDQLIDENEIDQINLFELLYTKLIFKISLLILNNKQLNVASGLYFIHENIEPIKNNIDNRSIEKLTYQFIDIFISIFKCETRQLHYTDEKCKNKSLKLISLPKNLDIPFFAHNHIPEIIPIENDFDTEMGIIRSSKKIKNGNSSINLSRDTKKALQISQKKKFIINEKALSLFEKLDSYDYETVKSIDSLPFVPLKQIEYLILQLSQIEIDEISIEDRKKILANKYKEIEMITSETNIEPSLIVKVLNHHNLTKELNKKIVLRRYHNTVIKFAQIFKGFPIYFAECFDYRLRMYTLKDMFSRTSGIRKYLLNEFNSEKLTLDGLKAMISSFFYKYDELTELKDLINSSKNLNTLLSLSCTELKNICDKTIIEKEKKEFFYKLLLKEEILKLEAQKMKTSFMIEVDQKTSGLVITALITGDEELAQCCNIIDGPSDAASSLMKKSYEFFVSKKYKNVLITSQALQKISTIRDICKKLQTFALYNQKAGGRFRVLDEYGLQQNDKTIIAKEFDDFLNFAYKSLSLKREKINKIIEFYLVKANKPIEMNTLDGSRITWFTFKKESSQVSSRSKYISPTSQKLVSYNSRKRVINKYNKNEMKTVFLPSFIHSIDGAIMRMLINLIYDNKQYIIRHLHDSIQFHPNYYEIIMEQIHKVYTSEKMNNIFEENVFILLKNNLLKEYHKEFDELLSSLKNESFKNNIVEKNRFHPKNMYTF